MKRLIVAMMLSLTCIFSITPNVEADPVDQLYESVIDIGDELTQDVFTMNLQEEGGEVEVPSTLDEEGVEAIQDALNSGEPIYTLWYFWVGIVIILWELVARLVPSVNNWAFTGFISSALDAVVANRHKNGGKFKSKQVED